MSTLEDNGDRIFGMIHLKFCQVLRQFDCFSRTALLIVNIFSHFHASYCCLVLSLWVGAVSYCSLLLGYLHF